MRICGMDEVGRGALSGPLVACALMLPGSKFKYLNSKQYLNDSKLLNSKLREKIYKELLELGVEYKIEEISVRQINSRGMGWANKEIFKRLIKKITADKYLVDGNLKLKVRGKLVKSIINADATRKSVMAASIIAKVYRDNLMAELHKKFSDYGWHKNVGYGTREHINAIKQFGITKHHRSLYVRTALNNTLWHPPLKLRGGTKGGDI
jgi:ribonuclease HII